MSQDRSHDIARDQMPARGACIAPATSLQDIEDVRGLFRAYAASLSVDLCFQNFDRELAGLPGAYAGPEGALLIARDGDGRPVGCAAMRPISVEIAEMKRLYVDPGTRGQKLGLRLAQAVIAVAKAGGYRELRLDTLPDMVRAQALYAQLGFRPIAPYYDTPVAGTAFLACALDRDA